jgi:phenylpyruvate tautomerase PptA (4-oxalocrotonate tautomerase family)
MLIKSLTDTIQECLDVAYADIHILLSEVPAENIGEGAVLMKPPAQPAWFTKRPVPVQPPSHPRQ